MRGHSNLDPEKEVAGMSSSIFKGIQMLIVGF